MKEKMTMTRMTGRRLLRNLLVACVALGGTAATAAEGPHWGYNCLEGAPFEWGEIDESFALCSHGAQQSPIDVSTTGSIRRTLPAPEFGYPAADLEVVNNGHTIQANVPGGAATLRLDTRVYQLVQFHWHTPSEHWLDGNRHPMEIHLVHRGAQGELVVVGALVIPGAHNDELAKIFDALPAHKDDEREVADFALAALLPGAHETSFRYFGSLTTPPCTQGVRWIVLEHPVELSPEQIEAFQFLFSENEEFPAGNARPLQPRNNRRVATDR